MFVFATYNTKDYLRSPEDAGRAELVEQVVQDLGAHAIALQELLGHNLRRATEGLARLARRTGMEYTFEGAYGGQTPAVAIGHDQLSVGLLWRKGVHAIPGTLQTHEGEAAGFWHALVQGEFEVEGQRVALASSHAPPRAGRERRPAEAHLLLRHLSGHRLLVLGQDRNGVGADVKPDGSFYDPDPYQPDAQGRWTPENPPETAFPTDRTPGAILTAGGLIDVAALPHLDVPWDATTGHWPGERNGSRRIDEIRASVDMAACAAGYAVVRNETTLAASDHLPALACFDLSRLNA
jgi:endonuclease/exonuclease/phosphatase family metal-dependent hydrolase